ncbi:MAG TPA: hypothetical protein VFS27_10400 [Blastocatellia bacterium]|jgi:UDP-galactopyranose mutase|nr:hypothetical protein [Blastocatellia bacterium]
MNDNADTMDMVCLSSLRWDFPRQRPQNLMSRAARGRRVFFVEEPVFGEATPGLEIRRRDCGVFAVTPHLREGPDDAGAHAMEQALLLDELFLEYDVCDYILWYYTPTAIAFTWRLDPILVVYDCIDEPPSFRSGDPASSGAKRREAELLKLADVVFTDGDGLYEAMSHLHHNTHFFPGRFPMDEAPAPDDGAGCGDWDDAWARMMDLINLTLKKRYSSDCGIGDASF